MQIIYNKCGHINLDRVNRNGNKRCHPTLLQALSQQ